VAKESAWELIDQSNIATDMPDGCETMVSLYRRHIPGGWLVLTLHVFDRRQRLGPLDLSLRAGRILSVQAQSSVTFVPDPERKWKV